MQVIKNQLNSDMFSSELMGPDDGSMPNWAPMLAILLPYLYRAVMWTSALSVTVCSLVKDHFLYT